MTAPRPSVLCAGGDAGVLSAVALALKDNTDLRCAANATAACAMLRVEGPFDVLVADERLCAKDGMPLLRHARDYWPDTARIALADVSQPANDASIDVFERLPDRCEPERLVQSVAAAAEHVRETKADNRLMETTLAATVKTFADVLALAAPWAFRRAELARTCVTHALSKLRWPHRWVYECAAALSQIGCVGIPEETLRRQTAQRVLTSVEAQMLDETSDTAYRLVKEIPRMERVADIVRYQMRDAPDDAPLEVVRGAQLLHAALTVVPYLLRGNPIRRGLDALRESPHRVDRSIIEALADFRVDATSLRAADVSDLSAGHVLGENVTTVKGQLLLSKGHELSWAAVYTLRRLKLARLINDPIYVHTAV